MMQVFGWGGFVFFALVIYKHHLLLPFITVEQGGNWICILEDWESNWINP